MPSTDNTAATRWRLRELPRKRFAASPERCSMCGRSMMAGERTVRLMAGPVHVGCEPGGAAAPGRRRYASS